MYAKLLARIFKGKIIDIETLTTMPADILSAYLFERAVMLARGIIRLRRLCFVGKGVTLKCKRRMKIGKFVTLHDFSYIDASSGKGIVIEDYSSIGRNTFVRSGNLASHDGYFIMRTGSSCNANCFLGATGGLEIGRNVMMGPFVSLLSEKHNYDLIDVTIKEQGIVKAPVMIEDDVWIGAYSVILGGNTIKKGAIIGAGSIVTKSVNEREIVFGNPAKLYKERQVK